MQMLKFKRLTLLLFSLILILIFGLTSSLAQEKTKIAGKVFLVNIKYEVIKLDDVEGHVLVEHGWKGVDAAAGSLVFMSGHSDYIKGTGIHRGYSKNVYQEGDILFAKFEGKTTTTLSPAGKPVTAIEGKVYFIKGVGKFENIQGNGTYKGKVIGPGILSYQFEGEYFIKK